MKAINSTDKGPDPTLSFLPGIAEKLDYYVYALRNPLSGAIFYVGKGVGGRVYHHAARAALVDKTEGGKELKLALIREIHGAGLEVGVEIIRHGLTEDEAFEVEAGVIDALRLTGLLLANRARGKRSRAKGWLPLEELRARYASWPVEIDPSHRVVLIRISRNYRPGLTDDELYVKTREWWRIAPRRQPAYAFAVHDGIVRAVFKIDADGWEHDGRSRWRFSGVRDPRLEKLYVWGNVSSYLPIGAQNPIRYVNC